MVPPVRIVLEDALAAINRPLAGIVAVEDGDEPLRQRFGYFVQRQQVARTSGKFNLDFIAIVLVKALQTFDEQGAGS